MGEKYRPDWLPPPAVKKTPEPFEYVPISIGQDLMGGLVTEKDFERYYRNIAKIHKYRPDWLPPPAVKKTPEPFEYVPISIGQDLMGGLIDEKDFERYYRDLAIKYDDEQIDQTIDTLDPKEPDTDFTHIFNEDKPPYDQRRMPYRNVLLNRILRYGGTDGEFVRAQKLWMSVNKKTREENTQRFRQIARRDQNEDRIQDWEALARSAESLHSGEKTRLFDLPTKVKSRLSRSDGRKQRFLDATDPLFPGLTQSVDFIYSLTTRFTGVTRDSVQILLPSDHSNAEGWLMYDPQRMRADERPLSIGKARSISQKIRNQYQIIITREGNISGTYAFKMHDIRTVPADNWFVEKGILNIPLIVVLNQDGDTILLLEYVPEHKAHSLSSDLTIEKGNYNDRLLSGRFSLTWTPGSDANSSQVGQICRDLLMNTTVIPEAVDPPENKNKPPYINIHVYRRGR